MSTENPWVQAGERVRAKLLAEQDAITNEATTSAEPDETAEATEPAAEVEPKPAPPAPRKRGSALLRKVLNLPEPQEQRERQLVEDSPEVERLTHRAPEPLGPAVLADDPATAHWAIAPDPSGAVWQRRALRGFVFFVVALFAWIGLRTAIFDRGEEDKAPVSAAAAFPSREASAVAGRFAWSYLGYDPATAEQRKLALALDYSGGADELGWNGDGRQDVLQVLPGDVDVVDRSHGTVTVFALVAPYAKDAKEPGEPVWRAIEVPVAVVAAGEEIPEKRVVVTGAPGLVAAIDAPGASTSTPTSDSSLTSETREVARAFFTAYAAGDVAAVIAPNSPVVAPAAETVRFVDLKTWSVAGAETTADDEERTATAVVQWEDLATGAVLEQGYTLTLTPVSSATGTRWQVNGLRGGL